MKNIEPEVLRSRVDASEAVTLLGIRRTSSSPISDPADGKSDAVRARKGGVTVVARASSFGLAFVLGCGAITTLGWL